MSYMTAGKLQAFEALMKEVPGHNHYDSGCDGICPVSYTHLTLPTKLEV